MHGVTARLIRELWRLGLTFLPMGLLSETLRARLTASARSLVRRVTEIRERRERRAEMAKRNT